MADESANIAAEVARAAIDLSVSATTTGFTVSLKIDNTVLAGILGVGALSLGAFYLANRRPVANAIRIGLENRNEAGMVDPEVRNIEQGSIFVELYCHSERSFLQFVEDSEAKKVGKRLEEQFTKIGFQQNLQVTIRNADEVDKKVKVIRLSRERIDTKEVENIPSANSKKRLKDMSTEGHQMLNIYLRHSPLGNDYRLLAAKMGYNNDYIKYLGSPNIEPVKELITKYEKGDKKIVELESLLKEIERDDVVEELQKYKEATLTPEELEERVQNRETIQELKTSRESYDAFICFAEKDREFVEKLVKKMESAPYNLHLCLSERDFVPGGSIYETTAVAIEQRCRKFVVILSRNFDDSEGSHYESHIAMNLSLGAKKERLIPVLIEEAYRYKIPRTISHIVYLDYLRQEENNFWNRLARSLGWKPK